MKSKHIIRNYLLLMKGMAMAAMIDESKGAGAMFYVLWDYLKSDSDEVELAEYAEKVYKTVSDRSDYADRWERPEYDNILQCCRKHRERIQDDILAMVHWIDDDNKFNLKPKTYEDT